MSSPPEWARVFLCDCMAVVELLLQKKTALSELFLSSLSVDLRRLVRLLDRARALPRLQGNAPRQKVMRSASGLRCERFLAQEKSVRNIEVRGKGIDRLWSRAATAVVDECHSWNHVQQCIDEANHMLRGLAMGPLLHFLADFADSNDYDSGFSHKDDSDKDDSDKNDSSSSNNALTPTTTEEDSSSSSGERETANALRCLARRMPSTMEMWLEVFKAFADSECRVCCVVADASRPGLPLTYCNGKFAAVAQYPVSEMVGRNCRFLQGAAAEGDVVEIMRQALAEARRSQVIITNVRANGDTFKNLVTMVPLFDNSKKYRFVLGFIYDLSAGLKNNSEFHLARVASMASFFSKYRLPYPSEPQAASSMLKASLLLLEKKSDDQRTRGLSSSGGDDERKILALQRKAPIANSSDQQQRKASAASSVSRDQKQRKASTASVSRQRKTSTASSISDDQKQRKASTASVSRQQRKTSTASSVSHEKQRKHSVASVYSGKKRTSTASLVCFCDKDSVVAAAEEAKRRKRKEKKGAFEDDDSSDEDSSSSSGSSSSFFDDEDDANCFLSQRAKTLPADYDGPPDILRRRGNFWVTRCVWLVAGAREALSTSLLQQLSFVTSAGLHELPDDLVSAALSQPRSIESPKILDRLLACVAAMDVVTQVEKGIHQQRKAKMTETLKTGALGSIFNKGPPPADKKKKKDAMATSQEEEDRSSSKSLEELLGAFPDDVLTTLIAMCPQLHGEAELFVGGASRRKKKKRQKNDRDNNALRQTNKRQESMRSPSRPSRAAKGGRIGLFQRAVGVLKKGLAVKNALHDRSVKEEKGPPVDGARLADRLRKVNDMRDEAVKADMDRAREAMVRAIVAVSLFPALASPATAEAVVDAARVAETKADSGQGGVVALRTALSSRRYGKSSDQDSLWVSFYFPAIGDALTEKGTIGFVVADARAPGLPLVSVNLGFVRLTRYRQSQAIGRNCRFLQKGVDSSHHSDYGLVDELRRGLRNHEETLTKLLNFDANGKPFQCLAVLFPIFGPRRPHDNKKKKRDCVYTVGLQVSVVDDDAFGENLLTLDTTLRHFPRTTTCSDMERQSHARGKGTLLDPAIPMQIACFLALDDTASATDPSSVRYVALLEALLSSSKDAILDLTKNSQHYFIVGRRLLEFVAQVDSLLDITNRKERNGTLARLLARENTFSFSSLEKLDDDPDEILARLCRSRDRLMPYLARMVLPALLSDCAGSHVPAFVKAASPLRRTTRSFVGNNAIDNKSTYLHTLGKKVEVNNNNDVLKDEAAAAYEVACRLLGTLITDTPQPKSAWDSWAASAPLPLALVESDSVCCANAAFRALRSGGPSSQTLPPSVAEAVARGESFWSVLLRGGDRERPVVSETEEQTLTSAQLAKLFHVSDDNSEDEWLDDRSEQSVESTRDKDSGLVAWVVQPIREMRGYCAVAVAGVVAGRLLADIDIAARLLAIWRRPAKGEASDRNSFCSSRASRASFATEATGDLDNTIKIADAFNSILVPDDEANNKKKEDEAAALLAAARKLLADGGVYDKETHRELAAKFGDKQPSTLSVSPQPRRRGDRRLCRLIEKLEHEGTRRETY